MCGGELFGYLPDRPADPDRFRGEEDPWWRRGFAPDEELSVAISGVNLDTIR
jgi:hypothetical protein